MAGFEPATYSFAYTSPSDYSGGLDCIFAPEAHPCQSFGPKVHRPRSDPSTILGALTVIRDSLRRCHRSGQNLLRPTMELLYQLSYIGFMTDNTPS